MNQNFSNRPVRKNRIQNYLATLAFAGVLLFAATAPAVAQFQTNLKAVTKTINTYIYGYQESLPNDYSKTTKKYPLLIFIAGIGEMGDGSATALAKVANVGITKNIKNGVFPASFTVNGESFSFIVISPQLIRNLYANSPAFIGELIDYCKKNYRVDESRVYVTGLSMGGGITWKYAGGRAADVAAIVPICGSVGVSTADVLNMALNNLPVWATHNSGDPTVKSSVTTTWVNALLSVVPIMKPQPLMSIFTANSHDAWTKTYDVDFKVNGKNVYEWMLQYKRGNVAQSPAVNPGAAQTITLPTNSVTLDGSNSVASTGTITSYAWTKASGGAATITSPSAAKTTITGLAAGSYTFTLTVTNSVGLKSSANVSVTVNAAQPPVAKPGSAQTITLPANSVTLDGSGSTTPAGSITSYAWTKASGGAATITSPGAAKTTITGLVAGTYTFTLTVTNSAGLKSSANVTVTVNSASVVSQPPVAVAGASQTITLPTNSITLDGSGSTTPSGTSITKYIWTKVAGGEATITNINSVKTTVTGLVAGTYRFNLTIANSAGLMASNTLSVTVNPAPISSTSPVANAGADKTITLPTSSVTVSGSASTAPSGNRIISYAWSKVSGGAATISNAAAAQTTITGLTEGTYVFSLLVIADNGNRSTDNVTVIVNKSAGSVDNSVPVANAGADKTITLPTNSVTVDGSASTAPSGSRIISYAWSKVSGGAATITNAGIAQTSITGLVQGTYTFSLLVIADNGTRSADEIKITVNAGTTASVDPVANAGADKEITLPTNSLDLDGSGSTAPAGGRIIAYEWNKISGGGCTFSDMKVAKTSVSGVSQGTYVFELTVTADNGKKATDQVIVTVNPSTASPVANAGAAQTITLPTSTVVLNASNSTPPSGQRIISYEWSKVSGGAATIVSPTAAQTSVTGLVQGSYVFSVLVTSDNGKRASANVSVTVKAAASARTAGNTVALATTEQTTTEALTLDNKVELTVAPNPAVNNVTLKVNSAASGKTSVLIYNLQGAVVLQQEFNKDNSTAVTRDINVSRLSPGIYVISVNIGSVSKQTIRLIKQ